MLLESYGTVIEYEWCLRPDNDSQHINLEVLDTVIKCFILALQGRATYHWLKYILTGMAKLHTKPAEMLVGRGLQTQFLG